MNLVPQRRMAFAKLPLYLKGRKAIGGQGLCKTNYNSAIASNKYKVRLVILGCKK